MGETARKLDPLDGEMMTNWNENWQRGWGWSAGIFLAILLLAGWLRFEQLGIKPLHHDEGVNGWFTLNLSRHGEYRYNPDNYHGPTLYYLTLLPLRILGENEVALRTLPATFGLLTVGLVWLLRRRLGPVGTPGAALLLALSTGLVYYSRDYIHEMIFGGLSLCVVVGAVRYREEQRFRWLALGALGAALLFATKETAMITAGVLTLAVPCAAGWTWLSRGDRDGSGAGMMAMTGKRPPLDHLLAGLIIFIFVNLVFYSSIFSNWAGVGDAVRSPWRWTLRSGAEHVKGFWYYAGLLLKLELPLLIGAVIGGALIAWRGTRFWLFVGAWTLGTFLAYSLIGYKTPWLIVSLLIPMALLGGHAMQRLFDLARWPLLRGLLLAALLAGLLPAASLTRRINLTEYDDNQNRVGFLAAVGRDLGLAPYRDEQVGYVYAQTDRDLLNLVELITSQTNSPERASIYVASPEYWPLPWYLRDYPGVNFSGTLPAFDEAGVPQIGHEMVVVRVDQIEAFAAANGFSVSPTSYQLRPGVSLALLVCQSDIKNESEILP